jgi:hypothetical protein
MKQVKAMFFSIAWLAATAAGADTHYVNRTNATPAPPYTNWAKASTNIQLAVDAAAAGDTVLVTNGLYDTGGKVIEGTLTNRVGINKAITVRSVNGPEVTIIQGVGPNGATAIRGAWVGGNSVLSGFMLTNGATKTSGDLYDDQAGGGANMAGGGRLTNCVLANCSANYSGGGSFYGQADNCIYTGNSVATNGGGACYGELNWCTLTRNSSSETGGGAQEAALNNCILTNNTAFLGGGAAGGTLNSCFLRCNTASMYGGGSYQATLNNCTLVGNSSSGYGGGAYDCTMANCIAWDNSQNFNGGSQDHCCTTPFPGGGSGNIASNPAFVDPAAGNYRLLPSSPCIDAGANAGWMASAVDLDGQPRIQFGTVDIGAYECSTPRPPAITSQPTGGTVSQGDAFQFSASASGTAPLFLRWLHDGAPVGGATNAAYNIPSAQPTNAGDYRLVVSNAYGSATSDVATLVVIQEPLITQQPVPRTVFEFDSNTFTVAAMGARPLRYQWRKDSTPIGGATNPSYTIASAALSDEGGYSVVVSNTYGSVVSSNVLLTVVQRTLGAAVEATNLAWSTSAGGAWYWQSDESRDGSDAARSGAIPNYQESWLQTTVTGPGLLTFWWRVSSEGGCDWLEFYLGGVLQAGRLSGESGWQQMRFHVPAGATPLRWRYTKDFSDTAGQDCAWVDQVAFAPDTDGDGMPDDWESAHGLNPAVSNPPTANFDLDPCTDWQEYVADTHPTNPASYFQILAISNLPPPTLYFLSSTNRRYTLSGCSNAAAGSWTGVPGAGPRPGADGPDSFADTNLPSCGPFYRLQAQVP